MPATAMFSRDDFRMAEQLAASQGKFLPSLNDLPEVKESSAFTIEAVQTTYWIGKQRDGSGARAQVLIRDFYVSELAFPGEHLAQIVFLFIGEALITLREAAKSSKHRLFNRHGKTNRQEGDFLKNSPFLYI